MSQTKSNLISRIFSLFSQALFGKEEEFTSGSIRKAVFLLSIPMIAEMFLEGCFALVDMYYLSQVGVNALATVGLTEAVVTLIYAVAIGLSMATTAVVSRRIGEKKPLKASIAGAQAIIVGSGISILLGIIGIIFPKEILSLMGAEEQLIEEGFRFTQILIGGNISIMLLFLINAIFRGAGSAKIAMISLGLASILNIILDPIFIFGFGPIPAMGVKGAAIATTIGRGTAVLFQIYMLQSGKSPIIITLKQLKLKTEVMFNLVKISLGGIGQFLIGTSSWMFLVRVVSEFGSEVVAGYVLAIRVMMFTILPAWGMSNAAATLVGQNLGAKHPKRAEESVWKTGKYAGVFMGIVSLIYIFFAPTFLGWFSDNEIVVKNGALCLQIMAAGYVFYGYGMVVIQSFNGAGDTKTPTYINFLCFWVFQLPLAYITAIWLDFGPIGVFISITLAEVLIAIIGIILFKKGKWKTVQV